MPRARLRVAMAAALVTGLLGVAPHPVTAAPPSNDSSTSPTVVTALPFSASPDLSEATVDPGDDIARDACFPPPTEPDAQMSYSRSVWFEYVVPASGVDVLRVEAPSADASTAFSVLRDDSTGRTAITCALFPAASIPVEVGGRYLIALFDTGFRGAGVPHESSTLTITGIDLPPAPVNDSLASPTRIDTLPFSTTVDSVGATVDPSEAALLATCTDAFTQERTMWFDYEVPPAGVGPVFVEVSQRTAYRSVVIAQDLGSGLEPLACANRRSVVSPAAGARLVVGVFIDMPGCGTGVCGGDPITDPSSFTLTVEVAGSPPPNDTIAGATRIPSLPYSTVIDNSFATVDPTESIVTEGCQEGVTGDPVVFQPIGNIVWYRLEIPRKFKQGVIVDLTGSTPGVGFAGVHESKRGRQLTRCSGSASYITRQVPEPGTYYIALLGVDSGGEVRLSVRASVPPPVVEVELERTGTLRPDGSVTIRGEVSCRGGEPLTDGAITIVLYVQPNWTSPPAGTQVVKQDVAMSCNGRSRDWSALVVPSTGVPGDPTPRFRPGRVEADVLAAGQDPYLFFTGGDSALVRLETRRR